MKLTQIKRKLPISAPSYNSGTGKWTITTGAHYLSAGVDSIKFTDPGTGVIYNVVTDATTTGTNITFNEANPSLQFPQYLETENFGAALTSDPFTFSFVDTINGIIHVVKNGAAAGTVELQMSLNGTHWVSYGAGAAIAATATEFLITKPYVYGRFVLTAVTGATGGTATIKAYKAGC